MFIGKIKYKVSLVILVATFCLFGITNVFAANGNGILFKIHDITPVKNRDGEVIACDFKTTIYNRSTHELKSALLNLVWQDTSIEKVISDEKIAEEKKNYGRSYSETERLTSNEITSMVDVPSIASYQQITLDSRINTDRCFLLLEDVKFSLRKCSAVGFSSDSYGDNLGGCSNLFEYVSPKDAQYYLNFKEITPEEQNSKEEAKKKEHKEEISSSFDATVSNMNSASGIIEGIK